MLHQVLACPQDCPGVSLLASRRGGSRRGQPQEKSPDPIAFGKFEAFRQSFCVFWPSLGIPPELSLTPCQALPSITFTLKRDTG